MTRLLVILPLFAALAAAPAFAAEPEPPARSHPAAAADATNATAPAAMTAHEKPAMKGCPMMDGKMAAGSGAMVGKAPDSKMMDGRMMDGKDMRCVAGPPTEKGADAAHDHDHPAAAPK